MTGSFIYIICTIDSCTRYDPLQYLPLSTKPITKLAFAVHYLCSWQILPKQDVYLKQQQNTQ